MSVPFPLPNGLPGAFNPVINSATTVFQVGSYNALTDVWSLELDLNDFVNYWIELNSMRMPQPPKVYNRAFNPRTPGETISHVQYKNRHIQVSLRLKGVTTQAIENDIRVLLEAIENPPYTLRIALPNATQYTYADVVAVQHNIPTNPQALKALVIPQIQIDFECRPGMRGDRQYLQNLVFNPGFEAPSGPAVLAFSDSFANVSAYTVVAGSAPTVAANVMTLVSGAQVAFGSPAWAGFNTWQVRLKWVTGLTGTFFLHYANSNNYVAVVVNGATLALNNNVLGVLNVDASVAAVLTNGNFYWLQINSLPTLSPSSLAASSPQGVFYQATLFNDAAGAIGSQVATTSHFTSHNLGAYVGQPQIAASGASLALGGAFSNVHTFSLLGPGGWTMVNGQGGATGLVSLAWEGTNYQNGMSSNGAGKTFPNGPVTSQACARLDMPPAGTVGALLYNYTGGTPTGTYAMPVATGTDVLGYSVWVRSSGLGSSAVIALQGAQFTSGGSGITTTTIQSVTGNQGSWTQLSGTLTTAANCAFAGLYVKITDSTTGSANGTLWVDNAQCWDVTATGMATMAYHELRFPQSPGQLVTSGLEGDIQAPAVVMASAFEASLGTGHNMYAWIGRRAQSTATIQMVGPTPGGAPTLDATAYGGQTQLANLGPLMLSSLQETGIYHVLGRAQTANGAPTGVWIAEQVYQYLNGAPSQVAATWQGPQAFQFTAANTWTTVDLNVMVLPPSALGSLSDATKSSSYISTTSGGSGGSQLTVNTVALLPVDSELFLGRLQVNSNYSTAITNQWVYLYWDGQAGATTYSVESTPVPNAAHSVANFLGGASVFTPATVALVVNPTGSTVPQVDPTVNTSLAAGVNQYLAHISDDLGAVLPIAVDIIYSPLYLFPR